MWKAELAKEVQSSGVSVNKSTASVATFGDQEISRPQSAKSGIVEVGLGTSPQDQAFDNPSTVPDGGTAAWLTVAGGFLVQMCAFGYTTSFGVFQDYYNRVYLTDESSSAISWIGSINAFLVTGAGLFVGRLYDRGYFYHLLWGGSLLLSFCLFMLSLAKPDQYYQIFLSQGLGAGIGGGMIYLPSIAVMSQYFAKRRPLAMTIVASGSSLGAVVHPIMINNMLHNPKLGFAVATRANAGMIAGLLLIACALMRTRVPPPENQLNVWQAAKRFSRDWPYVWATVGMTIFVTGFFFPLFYMQLDSVKHGISENFSFYVLVIANASSFFGRLAPGFLANKLGVENIFTVAAFVCATLMLAMIGLGSVASAVVIAIIYGFFAGTYIAMLAPFFTVLSDDMSELGARMGIAFALIGFGSLVGTPIDGALLTADYKWWRPALFSGLACFTGFGCYCVSVVLLRRRRANAIHDDQITTEKA